MFQQPPNKKINLFINEFEKEFGTYLMPESEHKIIKQAGEVWQRFYRSSYFHTLQTVRIGDSGKTEYSDWDLHCMVYEKKINIKIAKQMKIFVNTFQAFNNVGIFLSKKSEHNGNDIHISKIKKLQFMAFMKDEIESPFVDIEIQGISNADMQELSTNVTFEELMSWAMLTYWRKKLKGTERDSHASKNYLLCPIILQSFPACKDKNEIDLYGFFEEYLKKNGYDMEVNYLKK
jgi:hypothetical protein